MPNLLTAGLAYNPYFYAGEALKVLYKRLGMAYGVKRDLAAGKGSGTGDTIQVRRPQTYTTQAMPIALASFADVNPNYDNLVIDQWRGNGFKLTDKEKTLTPEVFVRDHLSPVGNAIADRIDADLSGLTLEVPWDVAADATNPYKDFPNGRKVLFDNKCPPINAAEWSYMTDGVLQARYETDPTFVQANTDAARGELQGEGRFPNKFGFKVFPNQNATTYTSGSGALTSPVVSGAHSKGSTTLAISGSAGSGTWRRGTIISIAGFTQKYAVKADQAVAAGGATVTIVPNLQDALAGGEVVTITQTTASSLGLMFHRDAFALVMQPLEDAGPGIKSATMVEELTGLTLRSRIWGDGPTGATVWALDALWGYKTLDPNLAVRVRI